MTQTRQKALADFLRSRRARLTPADVGLPATTRRLTAGLRREEVAQLAGISVDWYIRLEQGRPVSPSLTTIEALARALRLDRTELAHLRALAQPPDRRLFEPETVPPTVRRIVESLDQPAYLTGRRWDILAWNAAADAIFGFGQLPESDRNSLVSMLTSERARRLYGSGWADEARRMVAQFRRSHDLWAGDPSFIALLERLRGGCPEFSGWWETHDIRDGAGGVKRVAHPVLGAIDLQFASFQANDDPALKLVIFNVTVADEE